MIGNIRLKKNGKKRQTGDGAQKTYGRGGAHRYRCAHRWRRQATCARDAAPTRVICKTKESGAGACVAAILRALPLCSEKKGRRAGGWWTSTAPLRRQVVGERQTVTAVGNDDRRVSEHNMPRARGRSISRCHTVYAPRALSPAITPSPRTRRAIARLSLNVPQRAGRTRRAARFARGSGRRAGRCAARGRRHYRLLCACASRRILACRLYTARARSARHRACRGVATPATARVASGSIARRSAAGGQR